MNIFQKKAILEAYLADFKTISIGFVPTMGALHQGHLSLIKKAKKENELVVVSIFVNPTQFNNKEDLVNYPQTLEQDKELLKSVNCDVLFIPSTKEIYADNVRAENFSFDGLEDQMEGEFRKGHFNGVGTIVKTLLRIVAPQKAYFGEKDFQQLQIIKKMVAKEQIPVEIIGCKIFREKDGLAMSSRNVRLTPAHREIAPFIYKTLKKAKKKFKTKSVEKVVKWVEKKFKKQPLLELEYFTIANEETLQSITEIGTRKKYRAFIAVFAGNIRLIDNIAL